MWLAFSKSQKIVIFGPDRVLMARIVSDESILESDLAR